MTANKLKIAGIAAGMMTGYGIACLLFPLPDIETHPAVTKPAPITVEIKPQTIFEEHGIRPVYPHSLIPGGVRDVEEFKRITERDRTLRAFYSGFDFQSAKPCHLPAGKYFVTVRTGDSITWSTRPVEKGGQDCFSDGLHTILAKCGNEVSFIPQDPSQEVTSEEIAVPAYEVTNGDGRLLPVNAGVQPTPNGIVGLIPPTNGSQPYGQIPMPPILGIPVPPITILPVPPPTVQVPEPSTLGLSSVGIFILGFAAWINKRMRML